MEPLKLNKIIHERVRLAIMSALAARGEMSFTEMKERLGVTDGNLSVHSALLEKNGLIAIKKEFAGKKPLTTFSITRRGRTLFGEYVRELESMLGR